MMNRWLARLDAYGTDNPGFGEGHPEDRCPLCDRPVVDHPAYWPRVRDGDFPATWPHRRHALIAILLNR